MSEQIPESFFDNVQKLTDAVEALTLSMQAIATTLEKSAKPAPQHASRPTGRVPTVFPNYGRHKNEPIQGADPGTLDYYANGCRRTLADPDKARFHEKERALLQVIEAEMERQGLDFGPPPSGSNEPASSSGPSDEDIPF